MKTVHYSAITIGPIVVGGRVELIPLNHPGYRELRGTALQITNGLPCITSPIVKVYADGMFDTMNTRWVFHHIPDEEDRMRRYIIAKEESQARQ